MKRLRLLLILFFSIALLGGCFWEKKEESPPPEESMALETTLPLPQDNLNEALKTVDELEKLGIE